MYKGGILHTEGSWDVSLSLQRLATPWTSSGPGFFSRQVQESFLFSAASRPALEATQRIIQWIPVALSLGAKRSEREAEHSAPSSAEIKNAWSYTSIPSFN
jgi:hypothetical protein